VSAQTALERGRKMVTTHEVEFYIYIYIYIYIYFYASQVITNYVLDDVKNCFLK
jgi:hypothetical protein